MSQNKHPPIDIIVLLFVVPFIWATIWATSGAVLSLIIFKHLGLGVIGAVAGLFIGGLFGWMGLLTQGDKQIITWAYVKYHLLYTLFTSLPWFMIFGLPMSEFLGFPTSIVISFGIGLSERLTMFSSGIEAGIPPLTWRTPVWILGGVLLGLFIRLSVVLLFLKTDVATSNLNGGLVRWVMAGAGVGWLNALSAEFRHQRKQQV